jgi:hypothetical protein
MDHNDLLTKIAVLPQVNDQGFKLDVTGLGPGCQIARYTSENQGHYD